MDKQKIKFAKQTGVRSAEFQLLKLRQIVHPNTIREKSKQIVTKKSTWQCVLKHLSDKNILMLRTIR